MYQKPSDFCPRVLISSVFFYLLLPFPIPTAMPLLYELDENFKPIKPRGEYLDPEAAAAGAAAVAAQGQK